MKGSLPFLFLAALALALSGGILVLVQGPTTLAILLLAIGLTLAVGIVVRSGGLSKLGGMDESELSAAIRERAQQNWEMEMGKGKSPQ